MEKRNFFIIDFNAGNIITHHLNYVITYGLFFQDLGHTPKLVLPKYAPKKEFSDQNFSVERVLISRFYRLSKKYILVDRIHKILRFMGTVGKKISWMFDAYRDKRNLHKSFMHLEKIILKEENCEIIFPSVDLYTLEFIEIVMKVDKNIKKLYLRINAFEPLVKKSKGITGIRLLEKLSMNYPGKIVIGCETTKIVKILENEIKTDVIINFLPLPSINQVKKLTKSGIFGFIGGAKKRKGFCEIPNIIKKIDTVSPNAKFLVQQSPFNWEGYPETIIDLKKIKNVELLPSVLSNQAFFAALSKCDFIVLPYDRKSYLSGGSSIFYYASDFLIPVITTSGLPFSEEIQMFECGILFEPGHNFEKLDFEISKQKEYHKNLIKYNKFRNNLNVKFFNLYNNI